jgi:hypothetical protein
MLGQLIEFLKARDPSKAVSEGFDSPHSYRGYYDQVAFHPAVNVTIGEMLSCAEEALGNTYEGYKGGAYTMNEYTDTWLAVWGDCGEMLTERTLRCMVGECKTRAT